MWVWEVEGLIDVLGAQSSSGGKGGFCIFLCAYPHATLVEKLTNQIATFYNSPCFMQTVRHLFSSLLKEARTCGFVALLCAGAGIWTLEKR